jgi:hypothetical protein
LDWPAWTLTDTLFGGQNAAELVKQFEELNEGKPYDLIWC